MSNEIKLNTREDSIEKLIDGTLYKAPYGWFRGREMKFYPNKKSIFDVNNIIPNFLCEDYFQSINFSKFDKITAIGSCFASNFVKWFSTKYDVNNANRNSYLIRFNEGFVNTYSLLQQFEWALEKKIPQNTLWYDKQNKILEYDEEVRQSTNDLLVNTDHFIITLGLSEVCYHKDNGCVFWRAVPKDYFDYKIHGFRNTTVDENTSNLVELVRIIKKYNNSAKIIFTLSPIPLIASFRNAPIIQSSLVSKSILRISIDNVLNRLCEEDLYYWPSYELINTLFPNKFESDGRHVQKCVLNFIMTLFEYCFTNNIKFEEVNSAFLKTLES